MSRPFRPPEFLGFHMTKPAYSSGKGATKALAGKDAGKSRQACRWFAPVLAELKLIFPKKLVAELVLITNRHPRVCEKWVSGQVVPDGEAMAALQNSKVGDRVFLALTKGCAEPWRKKLNRQIEISQLRDMQRETAARLAALEGDL